MGVTCNIIEDLLPLYADGICSEDTRTIIEHHIAVCPECREKLEAMTAKLEKNEKKAKIDNPFKKVRNHYIRLVTVTLLVCALIIVPLGTVFRLKTNEIYDNGYSWASMKMENKLRKIGRLIKKGEYRKALDCFEPYYLDDYTAEEISALKDQYAEILEDYFLNLEIRAILYEPGEGDTDEGIIEIWCGYEYTIAMCFSKLRDGTLRYSGFYDNNSANYLPSMYIPERAQIERDFDSLADKKRNYGRTLAYKFVTEDLVYSNHSDNEDSLDDYHNKIKAFAKKYGYVGCEGGEITFCNEYLYNQSKFAPYYYAHGLVQTSNYYLQKTKLTMETGGEKFTVEFDTPIKTVGMSSNYSSVRNIVYSKNTPNEFKTMFEDIFVGQEIKEPPLNDGNFYLNGNKDSCYFNVSNGNIRFIVGSKEQMQEYRNAQIEAEPSLETRNFNFDEWYKRLEEEWKDPIPYIVHTSYSGSVRVSWNVDYDDYGNITGYISARYIDEDNIKTNGCIFTRVEE